MDASESILQKYEELAVRLENIAGTIDFVNPCTTIQLQDFDHAILLIRDLSAFETESSAAQNIHMETLNQIESTTLNQKRVILWDLFKEKYKTPTTHGGANSSTKPDVVGSESRKTSDDTLDLLKAMRCDSNGKGLSGVAGLDEAKQLLKDAVILPLKFPHLFTGSRKPWNSVLLYGPPGTGKTHLAHAVACEVKAEFYIVSPADLMSSWVGKTEQNIRNLFRVLKERSLSQCCIVFIDEIDGLCRVRTNNEQEYTRRMKTELLGQLQDSQDPKSRLFFLCATNCPWDIDLAFLRRFQRRIYIPLPDRTSRMRIIESHSAGTGITLTEADWEQLLDRTNGFTGSDLADLTKSALYQPLREMSTASYWMFGTSGKWMPCSRTTVGAIQEDMLSFPSESVCARDVTIQDFLMATANTRPTVSESDLDRYKSFTEQFGQVG